MTNNTHIFICNKCKKRTSNGKAHTGEKLIQLCKESTKLVNTHIHPVKCLGLCEDGNAIAASISHKGKQTMLLGQLTPDEQGLSALITLTKQTQDDPEGRLYWATMPTEMHKYYKYRIPANPDDFNDK